MILIPQPTTIQYMLQMCIPTGRPCGSLVLNTFKEMRDARGGGDFTTTVSSNTIAIQFARSSKQNGQFVPHRVQAKEGGNIIHKAHQRSTPFKEDTINMSTYRLDSNGLENEKAKRLDSNGLENENAKR